MPIGIVSVVFGARCEVLEDGKTLPCILRGRLKQDAATLAVGDRVEYQRLDPHTGVVERILERRNQLTRSSRERPRRRSGGPAPEQVVLANPDQVVFVAAARDPGINFPLVDRALVLARAAGLPAALFVNKMDLAPDAEIRHLMQPYERLGMPVIYGSAGTGEGLEPLRELLADRVSFFWGGSGVGKSSLIRALTGLDVRVGRWRTDNPRGPHTTNVTRLYSLPFGGLIADTPGFDWLELDTVDAAPNRAEILLPEASGFSPRCRFPGCSHCGEPDCAVMAAVVSGEIDRARYARFRHEVAETDPPPVLPTELLSGDEELFFRMRENNTTLWTTFQMYHLFQEERAVRQGLLETLGVPPGSGEPFWVVFQEKQPGGQESRAFLTAKVTGRQPVELKLREGQEVILRQRGRVVAIGTVRELKPAATTWRLRKMLKGTPIYEARTFWSDLKPPDGEQVPPVYGGLLTITNLHHFEPLPELALGAITAQPLGAVLDFLEVGTSEDELIRGRPPVPVVEKRR